MRFPFWIFLLFPILEMLVLIEVGSAIGALNAVALVILGAFVGLTVIRRQGFRTMLKARERMAQGEMPAQEMVEGFMIAMGGVLMMFPGFITDIMGICLLIPPVRKLILRRMVSSGRWQVKETSRTFDGQYYREDFDTDRSLNQTIDGEFKREDEKK